MHQRWISSLYQFTFKWLWSILSILLKRDSSISKENFVQLLSNKSNLFLILSIIVLSIVIYPIIIPHITHPSMIYHIILHMISFDVALFLTTISVISYKKTKSKKILLTALSFGFLLFIEFLYLLQSSNLLGAFYIPLIEVEFPHVLLLIMLGLFAAGVLRIERKWKLILFTKILKFLQM